MQIAQEYFSLLVVHDNQFTSRSRVIVYFGGYLKGKLLIYLHFKALINFMGIGMHLMKLIIKISWVFSTVL